MHISEIEVTSVLQGIITLLGVFIAAYFKSQLSILRGEMATRAERTSGEILELQNKLTEKIDSNAQDRQRMLGELKDLLNDRIERRTADLIERFVPQAVCQLLHQQTEARLGEVLRRIEKIEALLLDRRLVEQEESRGND